VQSWDFSLTEGENNVVPHYRLQRLFDRRRQELEVRAYRGGICFTMSPMLNQLSLYAAAQSFLDPGADPDSVAREFFVDLYGPDGGQIVPYLPLFEVIRDWGNYHEIDLPRPQYHAQMSELAELLHSLEIEQPQVLAMHPAADEYHQTLCSYADLFVALSAPSPDYEALRQRYWDSVYAIYDHLPAHVDPRPHAATDRLIRYFADLG
jgi:hypothetical protein